MPFAKGTPKPAGSGRQKGTGIVPRLNRRDTAQTLHRLNCDPIEGMARIALDTKNRPELRGRMFAELAQYCYPKLRSIELSGPGGGAMNIDVSSVRAYMQSVPAEETE